MEGSLLTWLWFDLLRHWLMPPTLDTGALEVANYYSDMKATQSTLMYITPVISFSQSFNCLANKRQKKRHNRRTAPKIERFLGQVNTYWHCSLTEASNSERCESSQCSLFRHAPADKTHPGADQSQSSRHRRSATCKGSPTANKNSLWCAAPAVMIRASQRQRRSTLRAFSHLDENNRFRTPCPPFFTAASAGLSEISNALPSRTIQANP